MKSPQDIDEYCDAIAKVLSGNAHHDKTRMNFLLSDMLYCLSRNRIMINTGVFSFVSSPHPWLFRVKLQFDYEYGTYLIFIKYTQDNECYYLIRNYSRGEQEPSYLTDTELREFIGSSCGWKNDFGQI